MTVCLWDSQSPASRSLWRWVPRCMRNWGRLEVCQPYTSHCGGPLCLVFGLNGKVMGNVLLQHEGMPARLLYSKLLEVRFHLFGDPPRINSTVWLLLSVLRQSIASNHGIVIH